MTSIMKLMEMGGQHHHLHHDKTSFMTSFMPSFMGGFFLFVFFFYLRPHNSSLVKQVCLGQSEMTSCTCLEAVS